MSGYMRFAVPVLAALAVAACDSTAPASEHVVHVHGDVLQGGEVPVPPLEVMVQAWSATEGTDPRAVTVTTDAAGSYRADLGPFLDTRLDSVRVMVTQVDCSGPLTTALQLRDVALGGTDSLRISRLALDYRLVPADFGLGASMCAAMVTPGDYARLALWIDDISDSVRGRWRLNHSASFGDDYGYFSGSEDPDQVTLDLRPTDPTSCSGLQLEMPVGPMSSTIGPSHLVADGSCAVASAVVRFFQGAQLSELLPPIVP